MHLTWEVGREASRITSSFILVSEIDGDADHHKTRLLEGVGGERMELMSSFGTVHAELRRRELDINWQQDVQLEHPERNVDQANPKSSQGGDNCSQRRLGLPRGGVQKQTEEALRQSPEDVNI